MFVSGPSSAPACFELAVPVDDPCAVEIVRRELTADAIAREDSNPEAAHLARDVSKTT